MKPSNTPTPSTKEQEGHTPGKLSNEDAILLIKTIVVGYDVGRVINIDHNGPYDKHGSRHTDSVWVINFNRTEQITIWPDDIKYYSGATAEPKSLTDIFRAYPILHKAGLVKAWNEYDCLKKKHRLLVDKIIQQDKDNELLKEQLETGANQYAEAIGKIHTLEQSNRELLEALEGLYNSIDKQVLNYRFGDEIGKAKAAIQKATSV